MCVCVHNEPELMYETGPCMVVRPYMGRAQVWAWARRWARAHIWGRTWFGSGIRNQVKPIKFLEVQGYPGNTWEIINEIN